MIGRTRLVAIRGDDLISMRQGIRRSVISSNISLALSVINFFLILAFAISCL